jgi:excisionase family DNA binding protein
MVEISYRIALQPQLAIPSTGSFNLDQTSALQRAALPRLYHPHHKTPGQPGPHSSPFIPMKILNPCLENIVSAETLAHALSLMHPHELAVAALRVDGLTDVQIAAMLGIGPTAVNARVTRARQRILRSVPELRVCLDDRRSPPVQGDPQLSGIRTIFTPAALAQELGVSPATVRRWCAEGRIPDAYRTHSGRWRIPAEALRNFEPPARRERYQRDSLDAAP